MMISLPAKSGATPGAVESLLHDRATPRVSRVAEEGSEARAWIDEPTSPAAPGYPAYPDKAGKTG